MIIDLNISKLISENKIFRKKPIVLMHIGSAGSNFKLWNNICHKSILISIDGNKISNDLRNKFKKIINNKIIISDKNGYSKFYITHDTDCSSLLKPNKTICEEWYGSHRFKIKKTIKTKVYSINNFLKKNKINYIDWLITDVQGKDLDIIKSIKNNIRDNIPVVEVETGFFPFYLKTDTIPEVFNFMSKDYQFKDMKFGTNFKVSSKDMSKFDKRVLFSLDNPSKIYSNINFLNKKENNERLNLIKLIYLIENNKIFEAREYLKKISYKNIFYKSLSKKIELLILIRKIKYIAFIPFLLFKKFLNKFFK